MLHRNTKLKSFITTALLVLGLMPTIPAANAALSASLFLSTSATVNTPNAATVQLGDIQQIFVRLNMGTADTSNGFDIGIRYNPAEVQLVTSLGAAIPAGTGAFTTSTDPNITTGSYSINQHNTSTSIPFPCFFTSTNACSATEDELQLTWGSLTPIPLNQNISVGSFYMKPLTMTGSPHTISFAMNTVGFPPLGINTASVSDTDVSSVLVPGEDALNEVTNFNMTVTPNTVSITTPSTTTNVAVNSNIVATFTDSVTGVISGDIELRQGSTCSGAAVSTTLSADTGTTRTLDPVSDLTASTTYSVLVLGANIQDSTSNTIDGDGDLTIESPDNLCFSFTTAAAVSTTNNFSTSTKSADNVDDVFAMGDTVDYDILVRNTGTGTATGVEVEDPAPDGMENLDVTALGGGTDSSSGDDLDVTGITVTASGSQTVSHSWDIMDENDFPLDDYNLDSSADPLDDDDMWGDSIDDEDIDTSGNEHDDADDATGAPDGDFASLGEDGFIVIDLGDKIVVDGSGDDFGVLEIDASDDDDTASESYIVSVSQDGVDFEEVDTRDGESGTFDLSDTDLTWAQYIMIEDDTGNDVEGDAPGVDIDAVGIINIGVLIENIAVISNSVASASAREEVAVDVTDAFDDTLDEDDFNDEDVNNDLPTVIFTANGQTSVTVTACSNVTLSWSTTNATSASIDQGIGTVTLSGSRVVNPCSATVYTITARGPGGTTTRTVSVNMLNPPPLPTTGPALPVTMGLTLLAGLAILIRRKFAGAKI